MKLSKTTPKNRSSGIARQAQSAGQLPVADEVSALFPSPRYFQIHFQHIHENTEALRCEVSDLQRYVATLEARLSPLLTLPNSASDPTL